MTRRSLSPKNETLSLSGQSSQWTIATRKLSQTLESQQRWVSWLGTCAEPSHRCHDPSYVGRPLRKTHGNRTNRPHMSTSPAMLMLGNSSVGPSFVARKTTCLSSELLRCARHPPFWQWHAQNSCRVLACEGLHRAGTPHTGDLSAWERAHRHPELRGPQSSRHEATQPVVANPHEMAAIALK